MRDAPLRIGLVYPELLGTYGDRGNALVLAQRCRWRGIPAEIVEVAAGDPVPATLDCYLLGGGEDDPQHLAAAKFHPIALGVLLAAPRHAPTDEGGGHRAFVALHHPAQAPQHLHRGLVVAVERAERLGADHGDVGAVALADPARV